MTVSGSFVPVSPLEARVCIIEDSVVNHTTVMKLLAYAGVLPEHCECKFSGQGVGSLLDHATLTFDLILIDLGLPVNDGYSVLHTLRARRKFAATRIVAVTGSATIEEMRKAQREGFDGFLGKPLLPERFVGQLQRILHGEGVWEYR